MMGDANDLAKQLAGLILYDTECVRCSKDADTPNPRCPDHRPFEPTGDNDAESTLNQFIRHARALLQTAKHPNPVSDCIYPGKDDRALRRRRRS